MSNLTRVFSSRDSNILAECHGPPLPDFNRSLWDMFATTAAESPHEEAAVSCWQPSGIKPPHLALDADGQVSSTYIRWSYGISSKEPNHWPSGFKFKVALKERILFCLFGIQQSGLFSFGLQQIEDAVHPFRPKSFR
jgi:hypothetical protein